MLPEDQKKLKEDFPRASSFILASELRYECFTLIKRSIKTSWDKKRIKELLNCPACKEKWFIEKIQNIDFRWRLYK